MKSKQFCVINMYFQELSEFKKSQESAARLLVYGGNNWVGKIFVQLLANSGIEYVHGSRIPGLDTDDSVYEEVVLNHPSHVVFLLQHLDAQTGFSRKFCLKSNYNNLAALNPYVQAGSGPTNLLHNTRNNLYAPWTLANMCQKAGIHFTYVGTHCIHTQSAVNSTQVIGEAANGDSPNVGNLLTSFSMLGLCTILKLNKRSVSISIKPKF